MSHGEPSCWNMKSVFCERCTYAHNYESWASDTCLRCFSLNGVSLLKRIEGSMDAKLYQKSILNDIDVVAECFVFPEKNFVFQQDLIPAHRALSTCNYFKSKNIQVLDWPGNSLHDNPTKNIWAYLKCAMKPIPCKFQRTIMESGSNIIGILWIKNLVIISWNQCQSKTNLLEIWKGIPLNIRM